MDKVTLLARVRAERVRWEALLGQIDAARLEKPGPNGWSIKDLTAHVAWYEREMVELCQTRTLAGSELWALPGAERNAAIYTLHQPRPLAEVQTEARRVYEALLAALETLSDEDLIDPSRFKDMPADWVPWQLIAENTFEHYPQHLAELRR